MDRRIIMISMAWPTDANLDRAAGSLIAHTDRRGD